MTNNQNKFPEFFQNKLPIFIFFVKGKKKVKKDIHSPLLIKSNYYNTEKMIYEPYHKPVF